MGCEPHTNSGCHLYRPAYDIPGSALFYSFNLLLSVLENKKETFTITTKQSNNEDKKGYRFNKKLYAIHLIACDTNTKSCAFRINGIPTGKLNPENHKEIKNPKTEFSLDETHSITIKNIQWNYCDNRRFCDYHYEAYNKVEVEIE